MTLVLNPVPPKRSLGQKLSEGVGKGLEVGSQLLQQKNENEQIKNLTGLDLSKIQDPNTRSQLLADQLSRGSKMSRAQGTSGINPFAPSQTKSNLEKELPEFSPEVKKQKTIQEPLKAPEEKKPVFSPEEVWEKGQQIAQQYRDSNIPMSDEEGYSLANEANNANITHNQRIETQTESYGNLGQDAINQVMPDASPELVSIFRGYGEQERNKLSPADARKNLAQKASQFKNKVSSIEKSIGPRRLFSGLVQDISGTGREEEKVKNSMREKLKFLHEKGLFDTERKLLSGLGYYPEEVESIITDLGENSQKIVAQLPEIKKSFKLGKKAKLEEFYSPENLEKINSNIRSAISSDPNVNLVLLRKAYEKKGVDWSTFKDVLDDMVINGEIILNPDQDLSYSDTLDQPPLSTLGKILEKLNLGGR